jgi:hypothetical protein
MIYEDFAQRFKREYEVFLFALAGRYLLAIAPGAQVSPRMINDFKSEAAALRETFLQSAMQTVTTYLDQIDAGRVTDLSVAFGNELNHATMQNIQQMVAAMKGVSQVATKSVKDAHGGMGLLLQKKLESPAFVLKTPAGRRFSATDLVGSMAREFAYRQWLHTTIEQIADSGDLAEVYYDNPDHAYNGAIFSISGESDKHQSWAWAERVIFHYNATAKVRAHVQA